MASHVSKRSQGAQVPALVGRENYQVSASSRRTSSGTVPTLKVIRLSDDRVIYPFQGHADMPFFDEADDAQSYAERYGWQLVDGDIAVPE
ncbi:hypothetical protein NDK50_21325 [Paraburkholderia bryophila]|uniref:DUF6723 family protein n=1 Tax=Paraburkholderia bryophila TaxID=420952 RepID=UPI0010727394|nr:DUF6723 family protein [Paraburkholderia bryophila]WCM23417.1 hypothetical protein NDK50_21325 [Paraburkholderia bryophila]